MQVALKEHQQIFQWNLVKIFNERIYVQEKGGLKIGMFPFPNRDLSSYNGVLII